MRTQPVTIEGLAGPVVVDVNTLTGRQSLMVGGQSIPGTRRGDYTLPTADGRAVPAKVRTSLVDPYPTIEIAGVKHRTGPALPVALRLLALLPFLLVFVGGAIGGALGAVGVVVNLSLARISQSTAVKALLMVGVLVATAMAYLVVAAAFLA